MNLSVVIPILNEEESIVDLLDSLDAQIIKPSEVIFVDGGSEDDTCQLIKTYAEEQDLAILLIEADGSNRAEARNIGIRQAAHTAIAVTDAGCRCDPRWLELLAEEIELGADIVAGYYYPLNKSAKALTMYWYLTPQADQVDEHFLPSSRSMAFKRDAFERVSGYPEHLDTCEDLVFARDLSMKYKIIVKQDALVGWDNPATFKDFYASVQGYARGDILALYMPHVLKMLTVYLRYVIFLLWWPLFFLYFTMPLVKFRGRIRSHAQWWWLPLVQVCSDIAVMVGGILGTYDLLALKLRRTAA